MSPTSYQLLYPAMLDYKGRNIFLKCKIIFKTYKSRIIYADDILESAIIKRKSPSEILPVTKISEGDFRLTNYIFINSFIPAMSVLAKDFCSPVVRFLSWMVPASASLPPLMERNGMDFFSA